MFHLQEASLFPEEAAFTLSLSEDGVNTRLLLHSLSVCHLDGAGNTEGHEVMGSLDIVHSLGMALRSICKS